MFDDLPGKVAVVTGGAGGIGATTAQMLAEHKCKTALLDIDPEKLERASSEIPGSRVWQTDVTDLAAVTETIAGVEREFGRVDLLINVAGGGMPRSIDTMTGGEWDKTVALNLTAPFNTIKAVAPVMRRGGGGSIVTVASLAALGISLNSGVSYTAAKAGILGLTRHAAYELASDNIRVNVVLPGAVLSEQMRNKISQEAYEAIPKRAPIGRWIEPAEVARTILFFCSDVSSACTGAQLLVDGGWLIGGPEDREAYFRSRPPAAG